MSIIKKNFIFIFIFIFISNCQSLGDFKKTLLQSEVENRKKLRKSLVAKIDISKGIKLTEELLTSKRPGIGIPPSDIKKVIGKITTKNIKKNTILDFDMFKNYE